MYRPSPLRLLPCALILFAGCSNAATTTHASGSTGIGGAGGSAATGSGGAGGSSAIPCPASGVSKGPWAFAADGTSIKVRWEGCKKGADPAVRFSPEMGGAETTAMSTETPFEVTQTFTAPLNMTAPPDRAGTYYMHEAALTSLTPGACYTYRLAADAALKGRFCTAKPAGAPFKFMAIGDTNPGLGPHAANVLAQILPKNPEFIVHGGDIQYYDSFVETWASWFPVMQPMLAQGAFFPTVGNHESEKSTEFSEYTVRLFGGAGFDEVNGYYRFESGGVWFFCLNTQESLAADSPQATWFAKELADAAGKPGYRFSIAYFHKPFVTCGNTSDDPGSRALFEPLFTKYKVPLVLQAHMHGYERFDFGNITYVTTAGGGGLLMNVDLNVGRTYCDKRKASGAFFHATLFEVTAGQIKGTVIDEQGTVRDAFTLAVP